MRPRKNLQRQINRRCVERIDRILQVDAERITCIKTPRLDDQRIGKITINPPVTFLVGIGQIAPCYVTSNAKMIEFDSCARKQTSMSRRLSRKASCAKAMHRN